MRIHKIANTPTYKYDDLVSASFNGAKYVGKVLEADTEENLYWIHFDGVDDADIPEALEDWMNKAFTAQELVMVQPAMDWESVESDLDLVNDEVFYYGTEWDVIWAKRLIWQNPRPVSQFDVKTVEYYIKSGKIATVHTDLANLQDPIIMATIKGDLFPIDGWHRIRRALDEGITQLPAYILTEEESNKVEAKY